MSGPYANGRPRWEVVGGGDKGGIIVRMGVATNSPQAPQRLETGSLIDEIGRSGDRINYRIFSGAGPPQGWVSMKLKDKVLLEERTPGGPPAGGAPAPAPAPEVKAPEPASPPTSAPTSPKTAGPVDFATRLAFLKEQYSHLEIEIPDDASTWSKEDLERYFESGGFLKPQKAAPKPKPKPKTKKDNLPDVPQFNIGDAQQLQDELKENFGSNEFQNSLRKLYKKYPNRREKGHPDGIEYFEAFEALSCTVYYKVLPKWSLEPNWEGVRDMHDRMHTAMMHREVKKKQEEINTLLGLPRDAVWKPRNKAEEVYVHFPGGGGVVAGPPLAMLEDAEGDVAHEFFVEDRTTGKMLRQGPSAL